jgi:Restriction endonuclease
LKQKKSKKRPPPRTAKAGTAFEQCVATVVRALAPNARVTQGVWVAGPDGTRDQDVLIEATLGGKAFRGIVECKDYDKSKTGPVGIAVVDALDSKRRDLACDLALICSNAGFTEPAIRKATRVGISLVGVFREGDERIRFQVSEYFYFRRLKIERIGFRLDRLVNGVTEHCSTPLSAKYKGVPISKWVCHHAVSVITCNPIGAGSYEAAFRFKAPTQFALEGGGSFEATGLFAEFTLSGGWFEQLGSIDGTAGLYDFIRRRAKVGTAPHKVHFKGLDLEQGTPVDFPPRQELELADTAPDESWIQLLYLQDCNCHGPPSPLEELIASEDLDLMVRGLPPELQRSPMLPTTSQRGRNIFVAHNPRVGADHSFTIATKGHDR